jgi:hypothetical protein
MSHVLIIATLGKRRAIPYTSGRRVVFLSTDSTEGYTFGSLYAYAHGPLTVVEFIVCLDFSAMNVIASEAILVQA